MRALGLATGLGFGALLQRGRLARHDVLLGQMLGTDWRVVKAMATAVAVGGVGVEALVRRGAAARSVKPMKTGGVVGGALLFGAGIALIGYCPGTCVAAAGEGRRDAVAGLLGMLVGAGLYVARYAKVQRVVDAGADLGKVTVPDWVARLLRARRPGTEDAALVRAGAG
jgi:uncharacterized membrane protein YedE/YeeE